MTGKVSKRSQFEQVLACRRLVDYLVLENPGEVVGDEDGMEAGGECGVHVGTGAVADHPGVAGFAAVMTGQGAVGIVVFLRQHLDWR